MNNPMLNGPARLIRTEVDLYTGLPEDPDQVLEAGQEGWITGVPCTEDGDIVAVQSDWRVELLEKTDEAAEIACLVHSSLDWEDPDIVLRSVPTGAPSNSVQGIMTGVGQFSTVYAWDGVPAHEVCLSASKRLLGWLLRADTGDGRGYPPYSATAEMARELHSYYKEDARRPEF